MDELEFLRPYKQLLPDIVTSDACLTRAIDLANTIYHALERKGHQVMFAPADQRWRRHHVEERESVVKDRKYGAYSSGNIWSPLRPTITHIGDTPFGIALTEMTERATLRYLNGRYVREDSKEVRSARAWQVANSWTREQDLPCGRFRLVAYSPVPGVEWMRGWQEAPTASLEGMVPAVVAMLESSAKEVKELTIQAEEAAAQRAREWKEQQERWRREEDQRQVKKAREESLQQLSDIMGKWTNTLAVIRFFQEAEEQADRVDTERRTKLLERLALARTMLGPLDPLHLIEEWRAPEERYQSKYDLE